MQNLVLGVLCARLRQVPRLAGHPLLFSDEALAHICFVLGAVEPRLAALDGLQWDTFVDTRIFSLNLAPTDDWRVGPSLPGVQGVDKLWSSNHCRLLVLLRVVIISSCRLEYTCISLVPPLQEVILCWHNSQLQVLSIYTSLSSRFRNTIVPRLLHALQLLLGLASRAEKIAPHAREQVALALTRVHLQC